MHVIGNFHYLLGIAEGHPARKFWAFLTKAVSQRKKKRQRRPEGAKTLKIIGGRHVEETTEKSGPPRAGDHGEPGEAATGDG